MEIHSPDHPLHSLKDFAIHIFIVTIGILIALRLEGVREMWRENKAATEAQGSFRRELRLEKDQLDREMASVKRASQGLKKNFQPIWRPLFPRSSVGGCGPQILLGPR